MTTKMTSEPTITAEQDRIEPVDIYRLRPRRGALRELVTIDLSRKPAPPAAAFPARLPASRGTYTSGRGADLAIDFGTSAIAAALVGGNYAVEELTLGDGKILPSPFGRRRRLDRSRLADNYNLSYAYLAGRQAGRGAAPGPAAEEYYPCLKRRIEWLARSRSDREWEREAVLDVAAICQLALEKARDHRGRDLTQCLEGDFRTYITVPNAFPVAAIEVLRRGVGYGVAAALRRRRRPPVRALLEAEAVAYGAIAGPTLSERRGRRTLMVVDAGAGTTDATILRLQDGDLRVLAHVGLPVGGMDLDVFLASLKGPFQEGSPVSQWLETARQAKQHHLREGAGEPAELFRRLGEDLVRNNDWPAERGGRPIGEEIAGVWERYIALAVKSLIRALPDDAVAGIDEVVLSGRGSLLAGFREAVRRTLAERASSLEPRCDEDPEDRKLAVVRGVGAYVASTYASRPDRRPARSSFEIFLRHENGAELTLLPAGHPLVRGWGVAAWYQPRREIGLKATRPKVEMRLVPREVLKNLAAEGSFGDKDLEELLRWSVLPVLHIEDEPPPYSACLAFDFLSLAALLEVDGRRIPRLGRSHRSFGRRHPVHRLDDNWFELSP